MNSFGLNIHHNDVDPFPVVFYTSVRNIYKSVKQTVSRVFIGILKVFTFPILALTLPLWMTVLYFILRNSNRKAEMTSKEMVALWQNEQSNEDMYDLMVVLSKFKSIFEREGEFYMPKHRLIFRPFMNQFKRFHKITSFQVDWLEEKIYPTAEELGISEEDVKFVFEQLTKEDLQDINNDEWGEQEKEILFSQN